MKNNVFGIFSLDKSIKILDHKGMSRGYYRFPILRLEVRKWQIGKVKELLM